MAQSAENDAPSADPMRYSVQRWAPTQPTPTLDYVLWLREHVAPEDVSDLADELVRLAEDGSDRQTQRIDAAYVIEVVMRHLAHRVGATPIPPVVSEGGA